MLPQTVPVTRERTFLDEIDDATYLALTGNPAVQLGFHGFRGRVAEVGMGYGNDLEMLSKLGANEVYGIEPMEEKVTSALRLRKLDRNHAICARIEDIAKEYPSFFDGVATFNSVVCEQAYSVRAMRSVLKRRGTILATFHTYGEFRVAERQFEREFSEVRGGRLNRDNPDWPFTPHRYALIGEKR